MIKDSYYYNPHVRREVDVIAHDTDDAFYEQYDYREVVSYYYDKSRNCLFDDDGEPFFGMYEHMEPWEYNERKALGGVWYIKPEGQDVMYEYVFSCIDEEEENED